MQKVKCILVIFLLAVGAVACKTERKNITYTSETVQNNDRTSEKELIQEQYRKDGIEAKYPKFVSGGSEEERKKWNDIIDADFQKILQIYSFNPFPEPTPPLATVIPTILTIKEDTKRNDSKFTSILYTAAFRSPYSAHPSDLIYTTNLNKTDSSRLKLSDILQINSEFIKNFRTWDFISGEEEKKEYNQAIKDYFNNMSDNDLQMAFEAADQIGSGNLWDVYTYLTPDHLGISIGVPNYIGDHVEFEREYTLLEDFLKTDVKP